MQTKAGTERGNRVEGAIMVPAGKEKAGWSRVLKFEMHCMKGGFAVSQDMRALFTKFSSTFCSLHSEGESQKMETEISHQGSRSLRACLFMPVTFVVTDGEPAHAVQWESPEAGGTLRMDASNMPKIQ